MKNNYKISLLELSPDEIKFRFEKFDSLPLTDMLILVYGYEYENINWDFILENPTLNAFPIRQYNAALEAIDDIKPKDRLKAFKRNDEIFVKKGSFIPWAMHRWPDEPRVKRAYKLWRSNKNLSGSVSPSLQTSKAIVKNYGDKIQIEQFILHCKTSSPGTFKANISQIAKQAQKDLPKDEKFF